MEYRNNQPSLEEVSELLCSLSPLKQLLGGLLAEYFYPNETSWQAVLENLKQNPFIFDYCYGKVSSNSPRKIYQEISEEVLETLKYLDED